MSLDRAFNEMFTREPGQSMSAGFLGLGGFFGGEKPATVATDKTAFNLSAFYNAVEQLSNDIAKLPKTVKQKSGRDRLDFPDHPLGYLIGQSPNEMMTAFDFWKVNVVSVIIKGNAYSRIIRNGASGGVFALKHLASDDVKIIEKDDRLFYDYKGEIIDSSDILHFKHFSFDGINGQSVISFAAKQLGVTLDSQVYQGQIYKDRGLGYGVIESDLEVNPMNKKAIEEGFANKMNAESKFKVPMLDAGMKYKSISISPAEAQFIETNKNGVVEVCRWLNIAPHKLKDLSNGTYSNIQQQSIEHVQDSILPWIVRMEQELSRKIFSDKEKQTLYVKFNEKSLLRGDLAARKDYMIALVDHGIMTRNEARSLEDMNPIEGLDEMLQMVSLQTITMANQININQDGNTN